MLYMPDYNEKELPERELLYGTVNTIYQDEMKELISITRTRRATKNIAEKDKNIEISKEIYEEIENLLSFPRKDSKIFNLISNSGKSNSFSKIENIEKKRIQKTLSGSCKSKSIQRTK